MNQIRIGWIGKLVVMPAIFFGVLHSPTQIKAAPSQKGGNQDETHRRHQSDRYAPNRANMKAIHDQALAVERTEKTISEKIPQSEQHKIFWASQAAINSAVANTEKRFPLNSTSNNELIKAARFQDELTYKNRQSVMKKYHISQIELAAIMEIGSLKKWPLPKP